MIGRVVGHYRIVEKIGAGGMGEVYRAHDEQLDRDVALKILAPGTLTGEGARKQFRFEALALAKLNHPNIETIFEFGTEEGIGFLAMELIPGISLSHKLMDGAMPEQELLRLGTQFAEGLAAAHEQGIIHRDLKPGNVMITPDGRLKILDFGLAQFLLRAQDTDLTQSITTGVPTISGTVPYMSPEQLRGMPVDTRSDIYATGAVLYEMATGCRPFPQAQSVELMGAILHQVPDPPSSRNRRIRPGLESVIMKALEKEPSRRYQSARELRVALEGVAAGEVIRVPARRTPVFVVMGAAAALLLMVGLALGMNLGGVGDRILRRGAVRSSGTIAPRGGAKARRSVAVLGFKNISQRPDEAWVSTALSEMLTTELAAGERLRAVPGENVARMKMNLSLPETDSYGKETLEKIRQNVNADEVVFGSYMPLGGGQMRIDLRMQDTKAGDTLTVASVRGDESRIDDLVSRAGATLREKLGIEQVSEPQALSVRATLPQNRDAARFYSEGVQKLHQFDYLGARNLLQQAVTAEPPYALAHAALAVAWKGLGYDNQARAEAKRAFDLSTNFSREDRLSIEGQYYEITNDRVKAVEAYRTLFAFFPDNLDYGLRLAAAQTSAAKGTDALGTVEALRKLPPPGSEDPRVDLAEATAAASVGDYRRQQGASAKAIKTADALGARLLAAQARISQCSSLRYIGRPNDAIAVCQEAVKIFEAAGDRGNAARALNNMAVVLMEQDNMAGARKTYERSLETLREIGDRKTQGMVLNNLAGVLHAQSEWRGSRKMLEEALVQFREIGEKGGVVRCLENIGSLLVDEGELEEARRNYRTALPIAREMGNKSLTAYALHLLGEVNVQEGRLPAARNNHEQAYAIRKEMGEKASLAQSQLALAALSLEEKQFEQAEASAREVVGQFEKLKAIDDEASAYCVVAKALFAQDKIVDAQDVIAKASELTRKGGDTAVRLLVTIETAVLRANSGAPSDISEARNALSAALTEATKNDLVGVQFQARFALALVEIRAGDRAAAQVDLNLLQHDATPKSFFLIVRKAREEQNKLRASRPIRRAS